MFSTHPEMFNIVLMRWNFKHTTCITVFRTFWNFQHAFLQFSEHTEIFNMLFRWFKFTLKPPNRITHDKLRLAIWDTSFWTFWLKFGHNGPWDISQDLFWSFLKYVNFWRFQGRLSTFQKMGGLRKSKFSRWRSDRYPPYRFSFRRRGP